MLQIKSILQDNIVLLGILFSSLLFISPSMAHAQSFLGGMGGLQIIVNPPYPLPNSAVSVSIDDSSLDTIGSDIAWYINGNEQTQFRNEREITVQTGGLGEKTDIRVTLVKAGSPTISATQSLIPTVVDIILETDTYVPYFYQGRALPSEESPLRAIAVVHDNTNAPDTAYTYKWSIGTSVFSGGPVKGKNVLEFTQPRYSVEPIMVEVFNQNGISIGKKNLALSTVEPELHFYEESPLRGLSEKEIMSPYQLIGEETTIHGEPYFMNAGVSENEAEFTWRINNEVVSHEVGRPNAITLRRTGGTGSAEIGLTILTRTQIPQFIEDAFQLLF